MRILINALSATSLAGKHVVEGLVRHLAEAAPRQCRWLIVSPGGSLSYLAGVHPRIEVWEGPSPSTHWALRTLWELQRIRSVAERWGATCVVSYSGVRVPGVLVPQVCVACNPRPLTEVPFWEGEQGLKHYLQRALYRWSSERAELTIFNSEYLRRLYHQNGALTGRRSLVIPHGLCDDVFSAASGPEGVDERGSYEIVSASVWSRYKGVETLVEALGHLRGRLGVPARLTLAGPWPHAQYQRRVQRLVEDLGLDDVVSIPGYLPRPQLLKAFRRARVFCLPSYTESFGIPALEAQAFGTPVVGSSTTAMAEVCGNGGIYCEPGQARTLASHLFRVLTDHECWHVLSGAARANAHRYHWKQCVRPLVDLLERHAAEPSHRTPPPKRALAVPRGDRQLHPL
jgi:glycosyltransferase involved in cell wall biosynthesis